MGLIFNLISVAMVALGVFVMTQPYMPLMTLSRLTPRFALHAFGLHGECPTMEFDVKGKRALMIATNHDTLGNGQTTGVYAEEITTPYYTFLDAGLVVDVASPKGGRIPVDPISLWYTLRDVTDDRYLDDATLQHKMENSLAIGSIPDMSVYDIVFAAGGWGAAFDLAQSQEVADQVSAAWASGSLLGGVCHGPLAFATAKDEDGAPLLKGRKVTAVGNAQIAFLGVNTETPLHPEDVMVELGADYKIPQPRLGGLMPPIMEQLMVVDDSQRIVTGYNQNNGCGTAQKILSLLEGK